ncbi:hypothetical protein FHS70_004229 [Flammeovirga yaeyamensis]|nr:hypothetical protein [Flammeovirga yaeyamensis]
MNLLKLVNRLAHAYVEIHHRLSRYKKVAQTTSGYALRWRMVRW